MHFSLMYSWQNIHLLVCGLIKIFPRSNLVSAPVILESKRPQRLEVQRFILVQQFEHLKVAIKDFPKQPRNKKPNS